MHQRWFIWSVASAVAVVTPAFADGDAVPFKSTWTLTDANPTAVFKWRQPAAQLFVRIVVNRTLPPTLRVRWQQGHNGVMNIGYVDMNAGSDARGTPILAKGDTIYLLLVDSSGNPVTPAPNSELPGGTIEVTPIDIPAPTPTPSPTREGPGKAGPDSGHPL